MLLFFLFQFLDANFFLLSQVGDYMERFLVQTRDVVRLLETARSGRTKDRRMAAFELASMAAAGDDNKFRIVAEGG